MIRRIAFAVVVAGLGWDAVPGLADQPQSSVPREHVASSQLVRAALEAEVAGSVSPRQTRE